MPKEEVGFWEILKAKLAFDPQAALLVDDNAEVLAAARQFGIHYLFFKAKSSSQLPPEPHPDFFTLISFRELME
jgi:putative hydrolase of the HAD superfamily